MDSGYRDLGDGYSLRDLSYVNTSQISVPSESGWGIAVKTHVLDYAFDSTFIIAAQRPWDSVPEVRFTKYWKNSVFNKSTFVQYWIINKKEECIWYYDTLTQQGYYSNVYGPFKRKEYLEKRERLGVPVNLKLSKYD